VKVGLLAARKELRKIVQMEKPPKLALMENGVIAQLHHVLQDHRAQKVQLKLALMERQFKPVQMEYGAQIVRHEHAVIQAKIVVLVVSTLVQGANQV